MFKKVKILFFSFVLLSSLFATNVQALGTIPEPCHIDGLYANPCVIAHVDGVVHELEQYLSHDLVNIDLPLIDFVFIDLSQEVAVSSYHNDLYIDYEKQLHIGSITQLPRSHIVV